MNILVIVPSLDEKGPNIVARNLTKYSSNDDIKYIFCSLRKNSRKLVEIYTNKNTEVVELAMKKFPSLKDIKSLRELVIIFNPDIIHAHTFWPTIIAGFFLKDTKKVVTIHNNPIEDYCYEYGPIVGWTMAQIFYTSLKKFDAIIPISNFVKSKVETGIKGKIKVIHNGIEDKFTNFNYKKENYSVELVTISALNKIKDVHRILEIIKLFKENNNIEVCCKIIGEGKELPKLQKFVKENDLNNNIIFLNKLPRDDVFDYIRQSDAFIFSSKSEGFGLVVVEALMMGKPVLVNDIPVMWEIVDNKSNGLILSSNSQFVDAILSINDIEKKRNMSLAAREKYLNNFTIDKMVSNYEQFYAEILKNKSMVLNDEKKYKNTY